MTHIESIESRQLFNSTGLDAGFGALGTVKLPSGATPDGTAIEANGATYVDAVLNRKHLIYKLDASGNVDASWGAGGRFNFGKVDIQQMAIDSRTGKLYVAANDNGVLRIERFTSAGQEDTTFGTGGIASYPPTHVLLPGDINADSSIQTIASLTPLVHQQLLLIYTRHTSEIPENDNSVSGTYPAEDELVAAKFTASGTRDQTFGKHGTTTVLSADASTSFDDISFGATTNTPAFGDIQFFSDGSFRLIASQQQITIETLQATNQRTETPGRFDVQSRLLTATGQLDTSANATWTLVGSEADGKKRIFSSLYVGANGDNGAVVVGQVTGGPSNLGNQVFRLTPNQRPDASILPVADNAAVTNVVRTEHGDFFAFSSARKGTARYVTQLTDALTLQPKWGDNGVAFLDDVTANTTYLGDSDSNLLVFDASDIRRFSRVA